MIITEEVLKTLTPHDRREIRNFQRFLALKPKYWNKMLTRPRWRKYLGLDKPSEEQHGN